MWWDILRRDMRRAQLDGCHWIQTHQMQVFFVTERRLSSGEKNCFSRMKPENLVCDSRRSSRGLFKVNPEPGWKTCVRAEILLQFWSWSSAGMHVWTQMVEVMLRTPRWYSEMWVMFWLMRRTKLHLTILLVGPSRKLSGTTDTLKLSCVYQLGFTVSVYLQWYAKYFMNTLGSRKMNAVSV